MQVPISFHITNKPERVKKRRYCGLCDAYGEIAGKYGCRMASSMLLFPRIRKEGIKTIITAPKGLDKRGVCRSFAPKIKQDVQVVHYVSEIQK